MNYEAVAELGLEGEIVFFSRSGYIQSPSVVPLFWLGDQLPSWDVFDGLKSSVKGLLMSG